MLSEERYKLILDKLDKESVVYLNDLVKYLDTSESTIRRDLNALHKAGLLKKVHGGATSLKDIKINTSDDKVEYRQNLNMDEKLKISEYAASLIEDNDLIYMDAGTTTELIIDFIKNTKAVFVTNGIVHAKKLIQKGCTTYILGGELKLITEAIVGVEAINSLRKYNFTKGFFGVNGVSIKNGFTTPDIREAMVKEEAINRTKDSFVLCDTSKFDEISSITFASIDKARIITTNLEDIKYKQVTDVVEVGK
ncbi:DeoR/GlpR family DNA-binding transcription regulator [Clostridium celatum]|uniref:Transcriptional regulator, DeoR family n=1 Tax=Clostridium celatum DSM 1785 TaxID=545697 RepID=L1QHS9_9CLOT|nr:DeoR/GlpR family DNA-binding transcription regulator [Clostridium celatum]EKY27528.1 transcriptional regulator, DeoR family [Clostridium celatum DSM 1785]MCE9655564.1 DeoR/GlpR family DNA-binding transcription regulator [Clostridium celatum]MDU2265950.1 DeoR/GlpR family DNA-binding transcription regulator [Clostridium celatum]MDU6296212.1 DeoR/GlpR family DNA-binding transcription regulator [Clostridium celatum]